MTLASKDNTVWEQLQQLQSSLVDEYAKEKGITCDEAFRKLYIGEWLIEEESRDEE